VGQGVPHSCLPRPAMDVVSAPIGCEATRYTRRAARTMQPNSHLDQRYPLRRVPHHRDSHKLTRISSHLERGQSVWLCRSVGRSTGWPCRPGWPVTPSTIPLQRRHHSNCRCISLRQRRKLSVSGSKQTARRPRRGRPNKNSDTYVVTTVLFAAVLFFAGVSNKMAVRRNRILVLSVGVAVLIGAAVVVATLPVERSSFEFSDLPAWTSTRPP